MAFLTSSSCTRSRISDCKIGPTSARTLRETALISCSAFESRSKYSSMPVSSNLPFITPSHQHKLCASVVDRSYVLPSIADNETQRGSDSRYQSDRSHASSNEILPPGYISNLRTSAHL